jgi:hypothetical protein
VERHLVGRRKGDDLIYAGKVDHGFDKISAADLQKRLKPLIRKTQKPYIKRIGHKGIWVELKLLTEIEYRAKSAEGKVRHRQAEAPSRTHRGRLRTSRQSRKGRRKTRLGEREQGDARRQEERIRTRHGRGSFTARKGGRLGGAAATPSRAISIGEESGPNQKATRRLRSPRSGQGGVCRKEVGRSICRVEWLAEVGDK